MKEERTFAAKVNTPHGRTDITVSAENIEEAKKTLFDVFGREVLAGPVEYDRNRNFPL